MLTANGMILVATYTAIYQCLRAFNPDLQVCKYQIPSEPLAGFVRLTVGSGPLSATLNGVPTSSSHTCHRLYRQNKHIPTHPSIDALKHRSWLVYRLAMSAVRSTLSVSLGLAIISI